MKQVSDTGAIEAVVDAVLAANPDKVAQYQGGKTGLIGFFVGQCMKEMRGRATRSSSTSFWRRSSGKHARRRLGIAAARFVLVKGKTNGFQ